MNKPVGLTDIDRMDTEDYISRGFNPGARSAPAVFQLNSIERYCV